VFFSGSSAETDSKPYLLDDPTKSEYPSNLFDGCSVIYILNSIEIYVET